MMRMSRSTPYSCCLHTLRRRGSCTRLGMVRRSCTCGQRFAFLGHRAATATNTPALHAPGACRAPPAWSGAPPAIRPMVVRMATAVIVLVAPGATAIPTRMPRRAATAWLPALWLPAPGSAATAVVTAAHIVAGTTAASPVRRDGATTTRHGTPPADVGGCSGAVAIRSTAAVAARPPTPTLVDSALAFHVVSPFRVLAERLNIRPSTRGRRCDAVA